MVRSDQAAEEATVAMLADDNLGEKLANIGLPLAQSSLEAFAAIEVTTISIWRLLSLMVRWQMLCRSRICQICRTRRSGVERLSLCIWLAQLVVGDWPV